MSKVLEKLKARHPEKIDDYYFEEDNGWFMHLHHGWCVESEGLHTICESTITDVATYFLENVRPCKCDDCETQLNK